MTDTPKRPDYFVRWEDTRNPEPSSYPGSDELLCHGSNLGAASGLTKNAVWFDVLPPGRRSSWPHAEADDEEFVFVVKGAPDVWIDGHLHRLAPGDFVGFPAGTGIAHTFINNTDEDVHLLVGGDVSDRTERIGYPLNPERIEPLGERYWHDMPKRELGPHDGLPDALRDKK